MKCIIRKEGDRRNIERHRLLVVMAFVASEDKLSRERARERERVRTAATTTTK
jgi:hypothetical protein